MQRKRLRTWYCLQTNTGMEYHVEERLEHAGFIVCLPLGVRTNKRGKESLFPLFPTYLFVSWSTYADWHPIMSMHGVKGFLPANMRTPLPINAGVVENIMDECDTNTRIPPGTPVRVNSRKDVPKVLHNQSGIALLSDRERVIVLFQLISGNTSKLFHRREVATT